MKSVEPSTGTSKRPRGEASTATPASGDMPTTKEVHVNPTIAMDPSSDEDAINLIVTPLLSLCAMMESFFTTQVPHGQLIDELLIKVAALKANFAEYRATFPPSSPSDA